MGNIIDELRDSSFHPIIECELSPLEERFVDILWGTIPPWYELTCRRRLSGCHTGDLEIWYRRVSNWTGSFVLEGRNIFTHDYLESEDLHDIAVHYVKSYIIPTEIHILETRKRNIDYIIEKLKCDMGQEIDP